MKVIHIAGFSNTGKTTFISALIPELERLGRVGVVKHIGHHGFSLEEGKDTTRFFTSGAMISAGIDARKSVFLLHENNLERILEIFCNTGTQYAIVEGFKEKPYPKAVIGSVPGATNVILENPSLKDVLAHLSEFADFFTPEGLSQELRRDCGPGMTTLVSVIVIKGDITKENILELRQELDEMIKDFRGASIRLELLEITGKEGPKNLVLGVCAPDPRKAGQASLAVIDLLLPFIAGEEDIP